MAFFQRHRALSSILKNVDFDLFQYCIKFAKPPLLESYQNIGANPRFCHRTTAAQSKICEMAVEKCHETEKKSRAEAEEALLDYLYKTRSIPFIYAEYMSTNSPNFLQKLLENAEIGIMNDMTGHSIARYLRYHPINEFEPFFESSGLKPYEFVPILPPNLMYLADDNLLLQNYSVLCNYGIRRDKIGKIYMEATEVFSYDVGILESKLQAFEDMGLHRSSVCMFVASTPIILINDGNVIKFVNKVNILGIENRFIEAQLKIGKSYNLTQILHVLCFIWKLCSSRNHVRELFSLHPDFLFEESGNKTFSLIGFLLKCGFRLQRILSLFLQFPDIKVGKFMQNMNKCYVFLKSINMKDEDIERIVQSYTVMLGSCSLKAAKTIVKSSGLWKSKLREIVKEDPEVMMKWVLGSKIESLPQSEKKKLSCISETLKVSILLELGFIKDSIEMAKAMKYCGCTVWELDERVDLFLKAGWDQKTLLDMLKKCPKLLRQTRELTEKKINVIIGDFGIPMSSIMIFPLCLAFAIPRLKHRFTMYGWLKNQGAFRWDLKLSYILGVPDKRFLELFVNRVAEGPDVWEEYKKQSYQ